MKNRVARVGTTALIFSTMAATTVASAGTASAQTNTYKYYATAISVNGQQVSAPSHIAAPDPFAGPTGQPTSFLPIFYLDTALQEMGITSTWDGHTLNLQLPSSIQVNYPQTPNPTALTDNVMAIKINGKIVTYAPKIAYFDAGSTTKTTFVPVFYLQKAFGFFSTQPGWDGKSWNMQIGRAATKLDAALAFAETVGLQPDNSGTNPYNDVPSSDWGLIHALTTDYVWQSANGSVTTPMNTPLFTADSSSSFGSTDTVTTQIMDRAAQVYYGWQPGHDEYLPNGSVTGFGDAITLNKAVSKSDDMTTIDLDTMMKNLENINKGYIPLGGGKVQLVMKPSSIGEYWNNSIPADICAQDYAKAISIINGATVTVSGGSYVTSVPGLSDDGNGSSSGNYLFIDGSQQYSLDGGKTWQTTTTGNDYDSLDPASGGTANPPSAVLLKDDKIGGLVVGVSYNGQKYMLAAQVYFGSGQ